MNQPLPSLHMHLCWPLKAIRQRKINSSLSVRSFEKAIISTVSNSISDFQMFIIMVQKIDRLPWQQCFPSADCFRDKDRYSSGGSTRRHEISCQQRPSPDEKHPDNPLRYATIRCNANSQSSILLETTSKFKLPGKFLRICLYQSRLTAYTEEPTSLKFACHSNPSRIRPNDLLETSGPGRPTD